MTDAAPSRTKALQQPCPEDDLRLLALDSEDLQVISTHMQDAVVCVRDMAYVPRECRFALVAARFDWCASANAGRVERARTGLHFERVLKASHAGFDPRGADGVLNLLDISFDETQAPAGVVTIVFSGGAAVRLEVECLEARMRDMGERWSASRAPCHSIDDDPSG